MSIESAARAVAETSPVPIFADIKAAITRQWERISAGDLHRTDVSGDLLWETYLASFPEGADPLFRKRTHHDCSCCRGFIRNVGNVVAIQDGKLVSLWDVEGLTEPAYREVAAALSALVKSQPIVNRFLHSERTIGTDKNHQDDAGNVLTWNHFFVQLPKRNQRPMIVKPKDIGPALSESRAHYDVLLRSLAELTVESAETVLGLIGQNALYRGEEHRHAVEQFLVVKREFDGLPGGVMTNPVGISQERNAFVWGKTAVIPGSVSKIRNTSIGQLLQDLSEGRDIETAVRSYERIVAPENYKRPTALVTPAMVARARETIESLGLTSALERRYATLADVSVANVLYADRGARREMRGNVFDEIAASAPIKPKAVEGVDEVPVDLFLRDVLPGAVTLEIIVENRHAGNFVSLIAPADDAAALLFAWDNRFSWSYTGDVADSIKERVKKAGGNVMGDLCCRLSWWNRDDLDLHMIEPGPRGGGYEIYYGTKRMMSPSGGLLDVDMNVGGETREPVENIFYSSRNGMREGVYRLFVHQYTKRESTDVGFEAEIDWLGDVKTFRYEKPLRRDETVEIARLGYTRANGIEFISSLSASGAASRKIWSVDTGTFTRVNVVALSPNHWDGQNAGNRHLFFFLDGCRNDGSARGFYNEFLRGDLSEHRKVLELVGAKMRAEESPEQLSGLGFSATQRNSVVARVTGPSSVRTVRVTF